MSGPVAQEVGLERSRSGKIGKFKFYAEPLIWVEGDDDFIFYDKVFDGGVRIEIADGRDECEFLIEELKSGDWPYAVILDGDYYFIIRRLTGHARAVRLNRYSIENYLFDFELLKRVCQNYKKKGDALSTFDARVASVALLLEQLLEMVVHDAINDLKKLGLRTFPHKSYEVVDTENLTIIGSKCVGYVDEGRKTAAQASDYRILKAKITAIARKRGLGVLLRGHFVFCLTKQLMECVANGEGTSAKMDDKTLLALLSSEVWRRPPTEEHKSLKRRLKRLVRDTALALSRFNHANAAGI